MGSVTAKVNLVQSIVHCDLPWPPEAFNPFPDFENLSDEELLPYLLQGGIPEQQQKAAFATLYNRYLSDVIKFIRSITRAEDVTREVFSEMWVTAIVKLAEFDPKRASFKTWLCNIAKWQHLYALRKESSIHYLDEIENEQALSYIEQKLDPETEPSTLIASEEIRKRADELVQLLLKEFKSRYPKNHDTNHTVLFRTYFLGQNSTEIGQALGKSPAAIRKIHERVLERLREIAKDHDYSIRAR